MASLAWVVAGDGPGLGGQWDIPRLRTGLTTVILVWLFQTTTIPGSYPWEVVAKASTSWACVVFLFLCAVIIRRRRRQLA